MQSRVTKFRTKPQVVEGWQFFKERLEKKSDVPQWVRKCLKYIAGTFVVENLGMQIEVVEGQWLIKMEDNVYPMTQEAVDQGLEKLTN